MKNKLKLYFNKLNLSEHLFFSIFYLVLSITWISSIKTLFLDTFGAILIIFSIINVLVSVGMLIIHLIPIIKNKNEFKNIMSSYAKTKKPKSTKKCKVKNTNITSKNGIKQIDALPRR